MKLGRETMSKRTINKFALAAAILPLTCATAQERATWPDGFVARIEIMALMQTLNANLLGSRSATLALEKWCADHKMADQPKVVAQRVSGVEKPASAAMRERLMVGPDEPLKYRRVRLSCGDHVLSEADNWYAPGRLSDEANRLLDLTDTPFGKAVRELQPFRRTIEVKMLWSPLPEGWESNGSAANVRRSGAPLAIPHELFEHRAILYSSDLKPFSEVDETYTSETLDFDAKIAAER